jgi:hypothetical protein
MRERPTWETTKEFFRQWFDPSSREFPNDTLGLTPGAYIKLITEADKMYGSLFAKFCSNNLVELDYGFALWCDNWAVLKSEFDRMFGEKVATQSQTNV